MAIQHNLPKDIPVIDLQPLTAGGAVHSATRDQIAQELLSKASFNGFVALKGHGIPQEHLAKAFATSKALFDLPLSEKEKAPRPRAGGAHRGFSTIGREQVATKAAAVECDPIKKEKLLQTMDHKETYDIGSDKNPEQENNWLPEDVLPGFQRFETDFYWEAHQLATTMRELLITSLGLSSAEADRVRAIHTGHSDQVRLAHYPPQPEDAAKNEDDPFSRIAIHTDYSMFTLLFQDNCGGLEFKDRAKGHYIPATPAEGIVYMNIGDMWELLSNGIYNAAPHRVVGHTTNANQASHSSASPQADRYSIMYFTSTASDSVLEPMPSLVTDERKPICEPIMFREFNDRFHRQTYVN